MAGRLIHMLERFCSTIAYCHGHIITKFPLEISRLFDFASYRCLLILLITSMDGLALGCRWIFHHQELQKKLDVGFVKVKGYGDDEKNIRVDAMARMEARLAREIGGQSGDHMARNLTASRKGYTIPLT